MVVRLCATDRAILPALVERLPPGWRPARAGPSTRVYAVTGRRRGLLTVEADGAPIARTRRLETALDAFESDLHHHVAEWAPRLVFVHAGVVGWRGIAILLPGRSMSGKTTLVRALLDAGAAYYSDEYAVLDERGRVHPFARYLRQRATGGKNTSKVLCPTAMVGSEVLARAAFAVGFAFSTAGFGFTFALEAL